MQFSNKNIIFLLNYLRKLKRKLDIYINFEKHFAIGIIDYSVIKL